MILEIGWEPTDFPPTISSQEEIEIISICHSYMLTTEGTKKYCHFENKARVQTIVIALLLVWVSSIYTYAVTEFVFHILFPSCPPFLESVASSQRTHQILTLGACTKKEPPLLNVFCTNASPREQYVSVLLF